MVISNDDIIRSLPHDAPRRGQVEALRFILDQFESGKKFVMLEAPTGSGKSAIGLALSEFFDTCFYLTIQKILQTQIITDYEHTGLVDLKGRNAYPCTFFDIHGRGLADKKLVSLKVLDAAAKARPTCDVGYCKKEMGRSNCGFCFPPRGDSTDDWLHKHGVRFSTCPYFEQLGLAIESPKVLTNFTAFLYQTNFANRFLPRDLLIIDEAHHIEPQIMDFVSLTISDLPFAKKGLRLPDFATPQEYAVWFHDNGIGELIKMMIQEAKNANNVQATDEATKLLSKYDRFMTFVADNDIEWISEFKEFSINKFESCRTVTLKPIFISKFVNDLLFRMGAKILMMSATILDANTMARSLAIDVNSVSFYRMQNYFPKENRPIYVQPAARATGGRSKMNEWGPKIVQKVDAIVAAYPDQRGIIHTHNFAIADMLMDDCKNSDRFIYQKNFRTKEEMLAEHASRRNGVIVAPAMHEGLNLKEDLSRFQIISKVPYPNFFEDKQLGRRVEMDRRYLIWLVAIKLVQSVGRSVRSDEDWAHTYIIDAVFLDFVKQAKKMLPDWFKESIVSDQ